MSTLVERQGLIAAAAAKLGKEVYASNEPNKNPTPRKELQVDNGKVTTLENAIKLTGLKDGMTISFHHHFRRKNFSEQN